MKIVKLNPFNKMIAIKPFEAATTTDGGLIQVNTNNTASGKVLGTILEAAADSIFAGKEGSRCFFRRYSMDELKYITVEGEQMVNFVHEDDILALPDIEE